MARGAARHPAHPDPRGARPRTNHVRGMCFEAPSIWLTPGSRFRKAAIVGQNPAEKDHPSHGQTDIQPQRNDARLPHDGRGLRPAARRPGVRRAREPLQLVRVPRRPARASLPRPGDHGHRRGVGRRLRRLLRARHPREHRDQLRRRAGIPRGRLARRGRAGAVPLGDDVSGRGLRAEHLRQRRRRTHLQRRVRHHPRAHASRPGPRHARAAAQVAAPDRDQSADPGDSCGCRVVGAAPAPARHRGHHDRPGGRPRHAVGPHRAGGKLRREARPGDARAHARVHAHEARGHGRRLRALRGGARLHRPKARRRPHDAGPSHHGLGLRHGTRHGPRRHAHLERGHAVDASVLGHAHGMAVAPALARPGVQKCREAAAMRRWRRSCPGPSP